MHTSAGPRKLASQRAESRTQTTVPQASVGLMILNEGSGKRKLSDLDGVPEALRVAEDEWYLLVGMLFLQASQWLKDK